MLISKNKGGKSSLKLWETQTWYDLEKIESKTAILPVGSIEQHGPHLPLATDLIIAEEIAKKVSEQIDAYLLPILPYSCSKEHLGVPGTISLRSTTLLILLADIFQSLEQSGVKYLGVVYWHGGNVPVFKKYEATIKSARKYTLEENGIEEKEKLEVEFLNPWKFLREQFIELFGKKDLHAGAIETSLMLYLRPELVRLNLAVNEWDDRVIDNLDDLPWTLLSESGVLASNIEQSSAEKGESLLKLSVEAITNHIISKFQAPKMF